MVGCITEIQRFSLNDGPGIRSTVFTKGCNMRCRWCHNPETISPEPELQFFRDKCIGCRGCQPGEDTKMADPSACFIDDQGQVRHDRGTCQAKALVKVGEMKSPEDILQEVLQDRPFYDSSGGGVTLSGGEVTVQPEFALEVLTALKAEGIHTAIETNLATPWSWIEPLLPRLDLILFDLKSMNESSHREWTGMGLGRILENLAKLKSWPVDLVARTPVIPGFNDTSEEIRAIAEHLRNLPSLEAYELLAFNPLGADKYRCMGKPYLMEDAEMIPDATMENLKQVAADCGLNVRIA